MLHLIKTAISFVVERLAKLKEDDATVVSRRKLDRGMYPTHDTLLVKLDDKKKVEFSSALPTAVETVSNRFIGGLMGEFAHGQIWIDCRLRHSIVPGWDVAAGFKSEADSMAYALTSKTMRSRIATKIEDTLYVWLLPAAAGNEFKYKGTTYVKMLYLRKEKYSSLRHAFRARFMDVRGVEPTSDTLDKMVKTLSYLNMPVYRKSFFKNVLVIDATWCNKPKTLDGAAMHFPNKDMLFHHEELGFNVTLSSVLHLRGLPTVRSGSRSGSIFKGTSKPVKYHQAKAHVKKAYRHIVIKHLEAGWLVCTPDTFKDVAPGRYHNMELWWHNDSNQISFWQDVKLCFPQWAMRRVFNSHVGLVRLIGKRVKDMGEALKDTKTLVAYILKNKKLFNDANTPVLGIVEGLVQVLNGRPFNLHRSDEFNILKPLCRMIKGLVEVRIGTRNMKHWNADDHNGLGARAFVEGDPELVSGEFGVPNFAMHMVKNKYGERVHITEENGKTYMTIDGNSDEARRHPQTITSSLPSMIVVRDDDFTYFTIPEEDMNDFAADFDGDKMEWISHLTSLYEIKDLRQANIDKLPEPSMDVTKLMPTRPAMLDEEIPIHHRADYEREASAPIGIVQHFIEQVGHYLHRKNAKRSDVVKILNKLELGPLCDIIKGKKHNCTSIVHLPEMQRRQAIVCKEYHGKGYRIIDNKIDMSKEYIKLPNDDGWRKLTLEEFPRWIKDEMKSTWKTDVYPIHEVLFKAIIKFFPDSIENTKCTDAHINKPKLNEIITTMFNGMQDVIQTKMKFYFNGKGQLSHEVLDKFFSKMMDKLTSGDPDAQAWIRRATPQVWDMVMRPLETDEERVTAEIFLMAFAFNTRALTTGCAKHGYIFNRVSGVAFREFIKLLYGGDGDELTDIDDVIAQMDKGREITEDDLEFIDNLL